MSFVNEKKMIIEDLRGNLYIFSHQDNKIFYYLYNRDLGKIEKKAILKNATNDFDGSINRQGEIYLVCKDENHDIVLLSNHRDFFHKKHIITHNEELQNIIIKQIDHQLHLLYHKKDEDHIRRYWIHHYIDNGMDQEIKTICNIEGGDILNPMCCMVERDELILIYFDLVSNIEQLFLRTYKSNNGWHESIQLTNSNEKKLYLDVLMNNHNLHLTYCEFAAGNLIVKYEAYHYEQKSYRKIYEYTLSNPGNCSHPILILHDDLLWLCWTEFNYIVSRYSTDHGKNWSEIYLWNESRMDDIILFRYLTNKDPSPVQLNYSYGKARELNFIGFGSLDHTSVIPLKGREKDKMEKKKLIKGDVETSSSIMTPENQIDPLDQRSSEINLSKEMQQFQGQLIEMNERITTIEEFLLKYTKKFGEYKD